MNIIYKKLLLINLIFTIQLSGIHFLEPDFNNPKEGTWYYTNVSLKVSQMPDGSFQWHIYDGEYWGKRYYSTNPTDMANLKKDLKDEKLRYSPIVMDRIFHFITGPASWFFQKLSKVHPIFSDLGDEAAIPLGTITTMALMGFGVYKLYKIYKTKKDKTQEAIPPTSEKINKDLTEKENIPA